MMNIILRKALNKHAKIIIVIRLMVQAHKGIRMMTRRIKIKVHKYWLYKLNQDVLMKEVMLIYR